MEFLVGWLNQIVLIVLFAVVLDLITPSSSMQKYIKLVMGLLIMVTLLKPVGLLFDRQFDISRIQWPENMVQFDDFDRILTTAGELKKEQARTVEEQVKTHLEKTVKQQVESEFPLEVVQVEARLAGVGPHSESKPEIAGFTLTVRSSPNGDKSKGIQPVQSVHIDVGKPSELNHEEAADPVNEELMNQVKRELAKRYQISGSLIAVKWNSS